MTTTKKILLVIGIIAIAVLGLIGFLFYATAALPKTANQFLTAISNGQVTEAYGLTSTTFKKSVTLENLLAYAHALSLEEFQSVSWPSRSIKNAHATLSGDMTLRSGSVVPLTIEMEKESGAWKIDSIRNKHAETEDEASSTPSDTTVPSEETAANLLQTSIVDFASALKRQDFSDFYAKLSPAWQKSTDTTQLLEHFQSFKDKDVSELITPPLGITLTELPTIDENGLLIVKGDTDNGANTWHFEGKYHNTDKGWKLFGFYVDINE